MSEKHSEAGCLQSYVQYAFWHERGLHGCASFSEHIWRSEVKRYKYIPFSKIHLCDRGLMLHAGKTNISTFQIYKAFIVLTFSLKVCWQKFSWLQNSLFQWIHEASIFWKKLEPSFFEKKDEVVQSWKYFRSIFLECCKLLLETNSGIRWFYCYIDKTGAPFFV